MINNFELVIGIEIHIELNTKTKCFAPVANDFNQIPNQAISPIDLGYPGTLPLLNQAVVIKAIKLAKALNMEIDNELHFDRKHYFYPDLPKGFQISQHLRPIGKNGWVEINCDGISKKIAIERIHIEEDSAKLIHDDKTTFINYNRAGIPLVEIVSKPEITNANQAVAFVKTISQIIKCLDISDAIMAKGSLRADINLSTRLRGDQNYGTRVEIKNLNSLNNVKKAIEFESQLQIKTLLKGKAITQATKRFDEVTQQTLLMRTKTDAIDYKYFPEPNIPVIKLTNDLIDAIKIDLLPNQIRNVLEKHQVQSEFIEQIIDHHDYWQFINDVKHPDLNQSVKIFFKFIVPLIKTNHLLVTSLKIKPSDLAKLIDCLKTKIISPNQLKLIITTLVNSSTTLARILKNSNLNSSIDEKQIENWINDLKQAHPDLETKYKANPVATLKFIMGQIMHKSQGQAEPILIKK